MKMFSANTPIQVRQSIVVKRNKISEYGSKGEMKPSGAKIKFYKIFSSKKSKYLTITGLDIEWSPTAPHLMEEAYISIKIKDSRASSSSELGDLLYLRKPAGEKWNVKIEMSLSTPVEEMLNNPPLNFDIDIHSGSMKSGVEIGKLKINSSILATSCVSQNIIKSAEYNTTNEAINSKDFLVWKGMPKIENTKKSDQITNLVSDYLHGNMTMETLSKMVSSLVIQ